MNINSSTIANNKTKHLIVVSYDAFSAKDWEYASALPNLSDLINRGSWSNKLRSVYPSLTYVVHSTIVSGCLPDRHGVYHNNPLQPFVDEKEQDWHWYRSDIKVPTIYDIARENGMDTASILWPVTAKAGIKYNLPEVAAVRGENQIIKVLRNGSPLFCLEMEIKFGKYRKGVDQPQLDDFSTMCACETIIKKKPELLLLHLIDVDDSKHKYGTESSETRAAIDRMDSRLGSIIKAVEDSGLSDSTAIVVLGDHGQLDVQKKVHLNNLLYEAGFIWLQDGKYRWDAYIQSAGGSAYIHIRDDDKVVEDKVLKILADAMEDSSYGIERILNRVEMDKMGVAKNNNWMIEAKEGYSLEESLSDSIIVNLELQGIRYATHGYSPYKNNYTSNLIVSGPGIRKNFFIGEMEMTDVAPTLATILGLTMENIDGKTVYQIFD
jgi:predicted AlkP superfamily pyrophosphatase or phosphodiesterase